MSRYVAFVVTMVLILPASVGYADAAPLAITTTSLPPATRTVFYSTTVAAEGGTAPYTWFVTDGTVPDSFSLSIGGMLSGVPEAAGDWTFTVSVRDAAGGADSRSFTLTVVPPPAQNPEAPVVWSSYLGGGARESVRSVVADVAGNVFITGVTSSEDFPTRNAFDATFGGGGWLPTDAFLAKVTVAGRLEWSTFIGGNGVDNMPCAAVDPRGNVVIAGYTRSTDFPLKGDGGRTQGGPGSYVMKFTTSGKLLWSRMLEHAAVRAIAVDPAGHIILCGSASPDFHARGSFPLKNTGGALVAKMSPFGEILWARRIGGTGAYDDWASFVNVGESGDILVTGQTLSPDFSVYKAFQPAYAGVTVAEGDDAWGDVFVARFGALGHLKWASYLGGAGNDEVTGAAVDEDGNLYVAGVTTSADFPVSADLDATYGGGSEYVGDGFVTKVSPEGVVAWSTYVGGPGEDRVAGISLDRNGYPVIAGSTASPGFPDPDGLAPEFHGGADGFIVKMRPSGQFMWSRLVGGSSDDTLRALAVDLLGNCLSVGTSESTDMTDLSGFGILYGGGMSDAIVARTQVDGLDLKTGYLGGVSIENCRTMCLDGSGNLFIAGSTYSVNFPTRQAFQPSLAGDADAFIAKLNWSNWYVCRAPEQGAHLAGGVIPQFSFYRIYTGKPTRIAFSSDGEFAHRPQTIRFTVGQRAETWTPSAAQWKSIKALAGTDGTVFWRLETRLGETPISGATWSFVIE